MSFTQWFTRSAPTVWCCPSSNAIFSFVPTPSAELTRIGFFHLCISNRYSAPKPPIPPNTLRLNVFCARNLIRSFARSPRLISTPASAYVTDFFSDTSGTIRASFSWEISRCGCPERPILAGFLGIKLHRQFLTFPPIPTPKQKWKADLTFFPIHPTLNGKSALHAAHHHK